MFIIFEELKQIMNFKYSENINKLYPSKIRKSKYYGFVIWDTYNNPIFPVSIPRYDESDFYYSKYLDMYVKNYSRTIPDSLPWHFFVEYIGNKYLIYNTRPYNYQFPLTNLECNNIITSNNRKLSTSDTEVFSNNNLEDYLHIIIMGDTESDIYTSDLYYKIGKYIFGSYKQFLMTPKLKINDDVLFVSLGQNFNTASLIKYL